MKTRHPQKVNRATLRSQKRQAQALELRRTGATYLQIAQALGVAKGSAYRLVAEALVSTLREPAEAVRALELERLDLLTRKLEPRINAGDDKAMNTMLKVMDHRAKLLGLFAPVVVTSPDGGPVRFVVEVPAQAQTLTDWQAQALSVIDVPNLDEVNPNESAKL
jgi:hypothetical protein